MRNQPRLRSTIISASVLRSLEAKASDFVSSADLGVLADGSLQTTALQTALTQLGAQAANVVVEILPGTNFSETSLTVPANVVLIDRSKSGTIRHIVSDRSGAGSITRGGLVVKSIGTAGTLLRNDDYGVAGASFVELRNEDTGGLAGMSLLDMLLAGFIEATEIATPSAPSLNKARIFLRDSGGKSQLCVRFNTGAVAVIATEP